MESKMRVFKDFDAIKAAVGTEVGASNWIEVTQERIEQFAQATGDNQWIHVDVERAVRELPTGTTIAHGLLTLSFAPVFIRDLEFRVCGARLRQRSLFDRDVYGSWRAVDVDLSRWL